MPESSIIKKYTDYIEAVKKEFPYLSNADIRRILKYDGDKYILLMYLEAIL